MPESWLIIKCPSSLPPVIMYPTNAFIPTSMSIVNTSSTVVPWGEFSSTLAVYGSDKNTGGESLTSSIVTTIDVRTVSVDEGLVPTSATCTCSLNDGICSRSTSLMINSCPVLLFNMKYSSLLPETIVYSTGLLTVLLSDMDSVNKGATCWTFSSIDTS